MDWVSARKPISMHGLDKLPEISKHFPMGAKRDTSVWVIIPVHNRRETTRACLVNLRTQGDLESFTVCVVEDASTDGTKEMLAEEFPEAEVVPGDGNLYWGGGIAKGMEHALSRGSEVMVWLNDDCLPHPGSIRTLVDRVRETKGLCGGVSFDPENPETITYSGSLTGSHEGHVRPAVGHFLPVDTINGNVVAIHREVTEAIGILPASRFPHYGGDFIYCLKAHRAGIITEIAGSATAMNRRDYPLTRFGITKPALLLWKEPFRTASPLHLKTHFRFTREIYGWCAYPRMVFYFFRFLRHFMAACSKQLLKPKANLL